jgi:putative addiction module killer protein
MEYKILRTPEFSDWFESLRDSKTRTRIQARIDRLFVGNFGDIKFVGSHVWEMRIDFGPGYRVYFIRRPEHIVILLGGGDKRTQKKDITKAIELAGRYGSDE